MIINIYQKEGNGNRVDVKTMQRRKQPVWVWYDQLAFHMENKEIPLEGKAVVKPCEVINNLCLPLGVFRGR